MLSWIRVFSHFLLIAVPIILILLNSVDFYPNLSFHCKNYFLGSFLYYLLTFSLVFTSLVLLHKKGFTPEKIFSNEKGRNVIWFMILFLLFASFLLCPPKFFLTKHIAWLTALSVSSIFIIEFIDRYPLQTNQTFFNLIGMTILLCIFVFLRGTEEKFEAQTKLLLLVSGLVFIGGSHYFFNGNMNNLLVPSNLISAGYVLYVLGMMPYIEQNFDVCVKEKADYINDTLAFFSMSNIRPNTSS